MALGTAAAHGSKEAAKAIKDGLSGGTPSANDYSDEEILALAGFLGKSPAHVRKLIAQGKRPPRVRTETTYA